MTDDMTVLETLYWWGVPTLFRCEVETDPARTQIALVGVPHSSGNGSTERDQHLGPRAVRHGSAHNRPVHQPFGVRPFEAWEPWPCRMQAPRARLAARRPELLPVGLLAGAWGGGPRQPGRRPE